MANSTTKVTKAQFFTMAISAFEDLDVLKDYTFEMDVEDSKVDGGVRHIEVDSDDMLKFFKNEVDLLIKRSASKSNKPSKKTEENKVTALRALDAMGTDKMTCSEIASLCGVATPQKMTALLNILVKDGKVERIPEGKKVYFKKV